MTRLTIKVVTRFDPHAVLKALDRAERTSMIRQLAFVRTAARGSLRRRKASSGAGEIPKVHAASGQLNLKTIFFKFEQTTRGPRGDVGPIKLNQVPFVKNETTVPNALEQGGKYKILEEEVSLPDAVFASNNLPRQRTGRIRQDGGRTYWWKKVDRRRRSSGKPRRWRSITIAARPFMFPALESEIASGNIMSPWHNSFHA